MQRSHFETVEMKSDQTGGETTHWDKVVGSLADSSHLNFDHLLTKSEANNNFVNFQSLPPCSGRNMVKNQLN